MTPQQQIERLQEENAMLRAALGTDMAFAPRLRLTAAEERLAGLLIKRRFVSHDTALAALYSDAPDMGNCETIKAFVCRLRRKLAAIGAKIETHYGRGWSMAAASAAALLTQVIKQGVAAT